MSQIKQLQPKEGVTKKSGLPLFLDRCKEIHQDTYDYSKVIWINVNTKVEIICKIHGSFMQTPNNHTLGKGCKECGKIKNASNVSKFYRDNKGDFSHIELPEGTKLIPLSSEKYTIVDAEDFARLNDFTWAAYDAGHTWYCKTNGQKTLNPMHRMVLDISDKRIEIDHKDHNGLNNTKSNLRICNASENKMNRQKSIGKSSQYKGVCWKAERSKWISQIGINGKNHYLGKFDSEIEAARAYDIKAKELFGEFAHLNFK